MQKRIHTYRALTQVFRKQSEKIRAHNAESENAIAMLKQIVGGDIPSLPPAGASADSAPASAPFAMPNSFNAPQGNGQGRGQPQPHPQGQPQGGASRGSTFANPPNAAGVPVTPPASHRAPAGTASPARGSAPASAPAYLPGTSSGDAKGDRRSMFNAPLSASKRVIASAASKPLVNTNGKRTAPVSGSIQVPHDNASPNVAPGSSSGPSNGSSDSSRKRVSNGGKYSASYANKAVVSLSGKSSSGADAAKGA
jgi:hypothetical protein